MKKKILVLTSIYPSSDATKGTTPVVHYFCKEWVKQGHEVIVIHNDNKYLLIFYFLPDFVKNYITSKFGVILPNISMRRRKIYHLDGVTILRAPILKILPFGSFFKYQLKKQLNDILKFTENENFTPDLITGHWENPQIELISMLNNVFSDSKSSLVIHVDKYLNDDKLRKKLLLFDSIGFRNVNLLEKFKCKYKVERNNLYTCLSGLPDLFLENLDATKLLKNKFSNKTLSIIYVGLFIKRKYPISIVNAIDRIKGSVDIEVDFIGEGNEMVNVKKLIKELFHNDNNNKFYFHNRIPSVKVKEMLIKNQVFVMISKDEAYGLVYLEAMASGCIVVASKKEGFDGIIKDGENGFLCEAGNDAELSEILIKINNFSLEDKKSISKRAIDTATSLTNSIVSKEYLNNIIQ